MLDPFKLSSKLGQDDPGPSYLCDGAMAHEKSLACGLSFVSQTLYLWDNGILVTLRAHSVTQIQIGLMHKKFVKALPVVAVTTYLLTVRTNWNELSQFTASVLHNYALSNHYACGQNVFIE